ncbi:unnamed protein product [Toxocara canis]|uniref:DM13 domain-containing protein n=1 Tax=Toxocara canis TaxID=6265 RepID=A0A183UFH7_TOXCA|nr:unnamed protein product [Toxocara canis]
MNRQTTTTYSTATDFHPVPSFDRQERFHSTAELRSRETVSGGKSKGSLVPLSDKINMNVVASQPASHSAKGRPYAMMQAAKPFLRQAMSWINRCSNRFFILSPLPEVQYSRLAPAPPLPLSATSTNIAESIFAQSQVRHEPRAITGNGLGSVNDGGTSLFTSENAIESISKFARNLLALPASNQELFAALASALTGPKLPTLTGNAVVDPQPASAASNIINAQEIFSSLAKKGLANEGTNSNSVRNTAELLLKRLPEEQRSLLQAAIQSGELDVHSIVSAIGNSTNSSKVITENRLLEWIQQNRPQINSNHNKLAVPSDKLPYYGKYCGSFSEQADAKKQFGAIGAVWAVDDRRFVVSKFHFLPGSLDAENVTFWGGPKVISGNLAEDMFPSVNGFYLRPQPIDLTAFLSKEITTVEAKIRSHQSKTESVTIESDAVSNKDDNSTDMLNASTVTVLKRRSLTEEKKSTENAIQLLLKGAVLKAFDDMRNASESYITYDDVLMHLNETDGNVDMFIPLMHSSTIFPSTTLSSTTQSISRTASLNDPNDYPQPLGWYAGFQPLLLTLPDDKWLKTVYWLSLRDHKRNVSQRTVIIRSPSILRARCFVKMNKLGIYQKSFIHEMNAKVLDTKTIEITNFTLHTDGIPAWFIVGKDILPNGNGHIVPIYERSHSTFDCDSLRDYSSETVSLRLPGSLDIKDVFWFSVFSLTQGVSLSHIYLPYNDMHLPPDLNGIASIYLTAILSGQKDKWLFEKYGGSLLFTALNVTVMLGLADNVDGPSYSDSDCLGLCQMAKLYARSGSGEGGGERGQGAAILVLVSMTSSAYKVY